nr:MAG TPA: hypothetical protein [Caudoviricetes sp.]
MRSLNFVPFGNIHLTATRRVLCLTRFTIVAVFA